VRFVSYLFYLPSSKIKEMWKVTSKTVLIFTFFIATIITSKAQTWAWARNSIGTNSGTMAATTEGSGMCADLNGNVFITGYFANPTLSFGTFTLNNNGGAGTGDIYIVKYSPNGNVIWAKNYGGPNTEWGYSVSSDNYSNVFLAGGISSPFVTFGSYTLNSGGGNPVCIIKYDASGNVLWAKGSNSGSSGIAYSVSTDINGNSFITGYFISPTITFGAITLTLTGTADIFVVKYDSNGNCADSLTTIADADAALGFHDNTAAATTNYGTAAQTAAYLVPGYTGPLNGNRGIMHFNISSIPPTATITAAYLNLFAYYPIGSYPGHVGPNNASYLQRVTGPWTESTVTWSTQPTVTNVNQVTLSGTTTYSLDYSNINVTLLVKDIFTAPNNYGFLLRLINEQTTNILAFCSRDYPNLAKMPYLTVYFNHCSPTGINETKLKSDESVSVFPNPNNGAFKIKINSEINNGELILINSLGQKVHEQKIMHEGNEINAEGLSSGLYHYIILQNKQQVGNGKMIVE
jgi:hypothetical protein